MSASSADYSANGPWKGVLERIEESLRQSLEGFPELPAETAGVEEAPLRTLDKRLRVWQARLDETEREAGEADRLLATEEKALGEWVAGAREKLARWAERGV